MSFFSFLSCFSLGRHNSTKKKKTSHHVNSDHGSRCASDLARDRGEPVGKHLRDVGDFHGRGNGERESDAHVDVEHDGLARLVGGQAARGEHEAGGEDGGREQADELLADDLPAGEDAAFWFFFFGRFFFSGW